MKSVGLLVDEITVHDGDGNYLGRLNSLSLDDLTSGSVQSMSVGFSSYGETSVFAPLESEFLYGTVATIPLTGGNPRWMPLVDGPSKPGSSRSFDWSKFDVVPPREFHGRLFFDFPPERSVPYSRRSFAGQAEATYYQISFLIGEVWAEQLAIAMENLSQRTRWSHPDLMRVAAETVLRVTRP